MKRQWSKEETLISQGMPFEEVLCCDELKEDGWEEGYTCSRPVGHPPPHREETSLMGELKGTDNKGRNYTWAYEWTYDE